VALSHCCCRTTL